MSGFNHSERFKAAVELLLKMQEIKALRGGWVVFNRDLDSNTANWYRAEGEAIWSSIGTCKARVPMDESQAEAVANLAGGIVFSIEEAKNIAAVVPDAQPEYLEAAASFEAHLFAVGAGESVSA